MKAVEDPRSPRAKKHELATVLTFVDDAFIQRKNTGELDQYYDGDHHEAIISNEDFDNAQMAVAQRAKEVGYGASINKKRSMNHYCFSGILICKNCGTVLHRQVWNGERPCWICNKHTTHPELCPMKPQSDADLKRAFVNFLNKLSWSQRANNKKTCNREADKKNESGGLLDIYEKAIGKTEAEKNAERLEEIEKLLKENGRDMRILNATIMRERFLPEHRERKMLLTNQEKELLSEKNRILTSDLPKDTLQQLKAFVNNWKVADSEAAFPEEAFTDFVEECVIDSGKTVEFRFKCGLRLTESLEKENLE